MAMLNDRINTVNLDMQDEDVWNFINLALY